jgi:hypothetical protein
MDYSDRTYATSLTANIGEVDCLTLMATEAWTSGSI